MVSKPSQFADPMLPFLSDETVQTAPLSGKLPSYIVDHRQRLRARFMLGGATAIPDYELLELVLFRAIPRRDVKPLAQHFRYRRRVSYRAQDHRSRCPPHGPFKDDAYACCIKLGCLA